MTDFYKLSEEDQVGRLYTLAKKSLPEWDIKNFKLWLLKYRENAVFGVRNLEDGRKYALRIHREAYHSDRALLSELQWMEALNQSGIDTPSVVPTVDGHLFSHVGTEDVPARRQCDLLGWVNGEPVGVIETGNSLNPEKTRQNYFKIGQLAAQIHNQGQEWSPPKGFWRHSWDVDGLLGDEPLWGQFWEYNGLNEQQRDIIFQLRGKLQKELTIFGRSTDRYGLTHADFLPENLLIDHGCLRIIDFDDCGYGWHLMDMATALFFLIGKPGYNPAYAGFLSGYRSVRGLPDDHLEMLPAFFITRGLVYLSWCHSRCETDTAKEFGPLLVSGIIEMARDYLRD